MSVRQKLKTLQCSPETIKATEAIYSLAEVKTGTGSGFDLGPLAGHLVFYCAYIASQSLNNREVSLETARNAACLAKAHFEKGVNTVRQALGGSLTRRGRSNNASYYATLVSKHNYGNSPEEAVDWMKWAESKLTMMGVFDTQRKAVQLAVFYWVLYILNPQANLGAGDLVEDEDADLALFTDTLKIIQKKGASHADRIRETLKAPQKLTHTPATPRSPAKTPQKRIPPMKPSPSKTFPSSPDRAPVPSTSKPSPTPKSPSKKRAPLHGDSKRKVLSDSEDEEDNALPTVPNSPSKKRRLATAPPSPSKRETVMLPDTPSKKGKPTFGVGDLRITGVATPLRIRTTAQPSEQHTLSRQLFPGRPKKGSKPLRHVPQESPIRRTRTVVEKEVDIWQEEQEGKVYEQPRRFRPVFLDMKQWNARDPRIISILENGSSIRDTIVEKFGDPFRNLK